VKAKILYGFMAVGLVIPVVALAGVVAAYWSQRENSILDAHFLYIIRTFWIGAGLFGLVALDAFGDARFYVVMGAMIWIVTRIVTGFVTACLGRYPSGAAAFA
jgi:uncharacterized membrane protein